MEFDRGWNNLICKMYGAAADRRMWPAFLDELAMFFQASGAQILHVDAEDGRMNFSILRGFDAFIERQYGRDGKVPFEQALLKYQSHFSELLDSDPRIKVMKKYPGRPFSCRQAFDEQEFRNSRMYQEINLPADCEYTLAVNIPEDNGNMTGLAVFRPRAGSAFGTREVEVFGSLIPHLKQSILLQKNFVELSSNRNAALALLDRALVGVVLVDSEGKIHLSNKAARNAFAARDGLLSLQNCLTASIPAEQTRLRRAIIAAAQEPKENVFVSEGALTISRPSGRPDYMVTLSHLQGNELGTELGHVAERMVVVYLTVSGISPEISIELLQRLFGLTRAEAAVTEKIAAGETLAEAASALMISQQTARTQLKAVFRKTNTRRQAELVKLVLSTPTWMGPGDTREGL